MSHGVARCDKANKCQLCSRHQKKCSMNQGCHKRFYRHMFFRIIYFFPFETSATASCGYTGNYHGLGGLTVGPYWFPHGNFPENRVDHDFPGGIGPLEPSGSFWKGRRGAIFWKSLVRLTICEEFCLGCSYKKRFGEDRTSTGYGEFERFFFSAFLCCNISVWLVIMYFWDGKLNIYLCRHCY